ncbi:MAG: S24/S26 family peptidase [Ruminococcus sp.]|nr:S24/S26 family peptidase [Ruminococcus sp.]
MAESSFEKILFERGELIYTNVGDSMYPLIQPRDLLVIQKSDGDLKRLDIPLYKRDNGQYVLHRIVKKRGGEYAMCGDNRVDLEYGITDRHILGVLTAIIRNGETIPIDTFKYKLYAHLRCDFIFFRRIIKRAKHHFQINK